MDATYALQKNNDKNAVTRSKRGTNSVVSKANNLYLCLKEC